MDNKDLITRFAEDCFRFEALHQEIDSLIADEVNEVLIYEYEDLANQAAEIVLKLSANGNNLGHNFYRYYVERLEYIIDYFRALLDYEETPLAEDEPNELDDEPAAVEEDDSEDEQTDEVDNENDTQAAESDEAADDHAAGAPSSEVLLPPDVEYETRIASKCWNKLSSEERAKVRDTFAMWHEMKKITRRHGRGGDFAKAVEELDDAEWYFGRAKKCIEQGLPINLMRYERTLRERINRAIGAIPGFRESEYFKTIIELYPTYKEELQ